MAESTYHRMSVQHIKYLDQHRSPGPVRLVHHQQPQSHSPGALPPLAEGTEVPHQATALYPQQTLLARPE